MSDFTTFPPGFAWGVATSAYQIEGSPHADGRGASIWDTFSHTPGRTLNGDTGDVACDHYRRWREDVDLIASLGVNAYRFSMAWPRVQPLGSGAWNPAGLAFYERLVDRLLELGIQPHATLYHWDLPQALQDAGGWPARDTALRFADYAAHVAHHLGDRLASLATHNEPFCTATLGHETGQFAPGQRDPAVAVQVAHHLLLSHGLAMQAMRATGTRAPLGIVLNQSPTTAATSSPEDLARAERDYATFTRWYMDPLFHGRYPTVPGLTRYPEVHADDFKIIGQPLDFLGINYYSRIWCSTEVPPRPAPKRLGETDMGWEIHPQGLTDLLRAVHRDYRLPPVYITENGAAFADRLENGRVSDTNRIEFVRSHLAAVRAAMAEGVDIRGYFYWSLMDNYEWNSGYGKRFGIVHVDYATQQRTLKDSALWYRDGVARWRAASGRAEA